MNIPQSLNYGDLFEDKLKRMEAIFISLFYSINTTEYWEQL